MRILRLAGFCLLLIISGGLREVRGGDTSSQDQSLIGLTPDKYIIGTWQPYLKEVNKCLNFRRDATTKHFIEWPEHECQFCCEDRLDSNHTIASYVHAEKNGRYLHPIPYYDVGIVKQFTPFWRCWTFDQISQKDITNLAYCEVNDLKRFYMSRFRWIALGQHGLLYSGIPFILLVEFLVLLSAVPKFVKDRYDSGRIHPDGPSSQSSLVTVSSLRAKLRCVFRFWCWESTWDLVHLCLLGINGSLLIEAVGHWDPCGWEAILLYNNAVVYTYLSLLSIISAVVQQVALRVAMNSKDRLSRVEKNPTPSKWTKWEPVQRYRIASEWQLQRICTQCAVCYLAGLYCTFVTVYERDEFVAWLLGIIIIAQVWSCVVGLSMLYKAMRLGRECWQQRSYTRVQEREDKEEKKKKEKDEVDLRTELENVRAPGTRIMQFSRARDPYLS